MTIYEVEACECIYCCPNGHCECEDCDEPCPKDCRAELGHGDGAWNVVFVHDYFTLTVTVVLVDDYYADSDEVVNTADAILRDTAGFSPIELGCNVLDIERLERVP